MPDEDKMVMVASTYTDYEARILGGILEEAGLLVQLSGEHTATFRTEAPGSVALLVPQKDAERAKELLARAKQEARDLDWDKIDFGTPG